MAFPSSSSESESAASDVPCRPRKGPTSEDGDLARERDRPREKKGDIDRVDRREAARPRRPSSSSNEIDGGGGPGVVDPFSIIGVGGMVLTVGGTGARALLEEIGLETGTAGGVTAVGRVAEAG